MKKLVCTGLLLLRFFTIFSVVVYVWAPLNFCGTVFDDNILCSEFDWKLKGRL